MLPSLQVKVFLADFSNATDVTDMYQGDPLTFDKIGRTRCACPRVALTGGAVGLVGHPLRVLQRCPRASHAAATAKADNRTTVLARLKAKGVHAVSKVQVMDTGVLAGTAPPAQPWITGMAGA